MRRSSVIESRTLTREAMMVPNLIALCQPGGDARTTPRHTLAGAARARPVTPREPNTDERLRREG